SDKTREEAALTQMANNEADALVVSLVQPLWDFNNSQVHALAKGALRQPDIAGIEVLDQKNERIVELHKEIAPEHIMMTVQRLVTYAGGDAQQILGSVTLYISNEAVHIRLKNYVHEMAQAIALFLALQLAMNYGILRLLLRPVVSITDTMLKVAE